MQFRQDWPKDKKITALSIFGRKTEHYGAPLEGSTIFLCPSSTCCISMESCRLGELNYAFFSRTGRKTEKLPCLNLFLSISIDGL